MPTVTADNTYYVDLGPDPDFAPGSFKSVYPESLTFDDEIRSVGNCAFQLSYSATDQDGDPAVTAPVGSSHVPFIGPYRSYYRLRYGNIAIQAGPIVTTSTKYGDDYMSIAGKTWAHFFERWQYPYNPDFTPRVGGQPRTAPVFDYDIGTPPPDLIYQVIDRDIIFILSDLFSSIQNLVPYRIIFDITSLASASGEAVRYSRSKGDMSYFNTVVDELADTGKGFDWWITWDKKFLWASPYRFGNPSMPVLLDVYDNDVNPPLDLEFTNDGPGATHITGRGSGLATSRQLASAYGYDVNQQQFSRMDADFDLGDVRNQIALNRKTQKKLTTVVQPHHNITLILDPRSIPDYWTDYRVGRAVLISMDLGYHLLDDNVRLKSYNCSVDEEGTATVRWDVEQIFDLSLADGTWEG